MYTEDTHGDTHELPHTCSWIIVLIVPIKETPKRAQTTTTSSTKLHHGNVRAVDTNDTVEFAVGAGHMLYKLYSKRPAATDTLTHSGVLFHASISWGGSVEVIHRAQQAKHAHHVASPFAHLGTHRLNSKACIGQVHLHRNLFAKLYHLTRCLC